jgi:hypothetical protein
MRKILKRNNPQDIMLKISKATVVLRGWANYFKLTQAKSPIAALDGFIRNRCRIVIWTQFKRIRTKYKLLRRHGVKHDQAYQWANTSKRAARTASSPILKRTFDVATLTKMGLLSLENHLFTNRNLQTKFTF